MKAASLAFEFNWKLKLEMSVAMALAAAYSFRHPQKAWPRVKRAFTLWWRVHGSQDWTVTHEKHNRRMDVCKKCPIFYPRFKTCGSPMKKGAEDLGCHCYLPVKASLVAARCWGDEQLPGEFEYGWRANDVE